MLLEGDQRAIRQLFRELLHDLSCSPQLLHRSTATSGPGPQTRSFTITLRRTTFGRNPLDEWSTHRRDLYLHYTQKSYETHIHGSGGFRNRDTEKRVAADWRHCCIIGCAVTDMWQVGNVKLLENVRKIWQKKLKGRHIKFRLKDNIKTDRVAVGCKTS
jgi:hypothetical protein